MKHLVKHSFKILDRNYRKKWGEIDIVAKKDNILHFIEVKTIQCSYEKPIKTENLSTGRKYAFLETATIGKNH